MRWALCGWRARRWLSRRVPEEAERGGGAIPFASSKAGPRAWSVRRSMGSDHERPWGRVLPLSLLCAGLLLWAAFRESSDIDRRLEAALSGQAPDSDPPRPQR
ncbi:ubiquinol-cytochrome c reductase complex assembly factor 4 [Phaenicophaeus curvirostris]|uniref:ubiquinol-cytochrome c reductase complex assembly factor 4 n=1 Tax=Phaenicophaeus curvirostris TaxID=33595 RepID=UPI0037F0E90B